MNIGGLPNNIQRQISKMGNASQTLPGFNRYNDLPNIATNVIRPIKNAALLNNVLKAVNKAIRIHDYTADMILPDMPQNMIYGSAINNHNKAIASGGFTIIVGSVR